MQKIKLWEDTKKTSGSGYLNLRMAKVECEYGGALLSSVAFYIFNNGHVLFGIL